MSKVELHDGRTVEVRDRISNGERRAYLRAITQLNTDDVAEVAYTGSDLLMKLMVVAASDESITVPLTDEQINEMDASDYDAILIESQKTLRLLFPQFDPTPDPDSPTRPSAA